VKIRGIRLPFYPPPCPYIDVEKTRKTPYLMRQEEGRIRIHQLARARKW
jgi:hypothetical protein